MSKGKVIYEQVNPEAFSDAEDRAVGAGLQALSLGQGSGNGYFGYADLQYDYVAAPPKWAAAVRESQQIWVATKAARKTGDQILIAEDGTVQRDRIARLLEQRNNRRVNFQE